MSQFGILLTQNCSWAELQTHARKVEELGFNSLWVADSFANPFIETEWLEGWTTLAGLSQATQSIRIGTLVTNIVYRHPAIIAKQAITVDHMSNGRLELGLGAGGVPTDHSMTGTPMWTGKERQARFAEFVTVVNKLLTQETSSFSGEYYSFEDAYVSPPPHQQPILPLVIAAHGPKSMRLAARYASKWSFSDPGLGRKGKEAAAAIREMNNYLDDQLRSVGRNPEEITRSLCCGYCAATMWSSL
ncbi:MAG: LLM class flavin-dependent oxidoreductase, partial [Gammaproteobacteria bacterium]|nr:LLM class flavin-dependent oxidoreductase [Gammaproteobacteria bacterium]